MISLIFFDRKSFSFSKYTSLFIKSSEAITLTYLGLAQASRETMLDQIDFG
ncbi:hypothetical protein GRR92_14390 [Lactococcus lactis subsp. lactis]|nr:hypothetical protein [Lactococcus lactis subsp. lactis]MBR8678258.1 hypothetical protein [Lactococcus lactis subsp. lactis]MBR8685745.1 hypothetical protein [Lactococcus lactis subsp. lactis]